MTRALHHRLIAVLPLVAFCSALPLLADGPVIPEPKVIAAIEKVAGQAHSCIATVSVRTPDTDEALAAPSFRVPAGHGASSTDTFSGPAGFLSVAVAVTAAADCAGGAFDVKVSTNGSLSLAKAGALLPRAK